MDTELKLNSPKDMRKLIRSWIQEACQLKHMPFEKDGGIIIQALNLWLRSYEAEKVSDLEKRVAELEKEHTKGAKPQ